MHFVYTFTLVYVEALLTKQGIEHETTLKKYTHGKKGVVNSEITMHTHTHVYKIHLMPVYIIYFYIKIFFIENFST